MIGRSHGIGGLGLARLSLSQQEPAVLLYRSQISDMCNGWNNAWGQGSGQLPGLIRGWEVAAGAIKHMLIMGLPYQLILPVTTPWNGAFGQYTGVIQYGSTFGIPSTVDVSTLGLSPGALSLLMPCKTRSY